MSSKERRNFYQASTILLAQMRQYSRILPEKLEHMERIYLKRHAISYTENEAFQIDYYRKASIYKFIFATYTLEQMWAMPTQITKLNMMSIMQNNLDELDLSQDEVFLASYHLENFLYHGVAFLDFVALHITLILKTGHSGRMNPKTLLKSLDKVTIKSLIPKSVKIKAYFEEQVYNNGGWGNKLRFLRNWIVHRDKPRPTTTDDLISKVRSEYPMLEEESLGRFQQDMQNSWFFFYNDLAPMLYDLEWKSGPYREGMWEKY